MQYEVCIGLETYTTAGIHRHQNESGGYGLITSDEGQVLLAAINCKQGKCEGERGLLCEMWGWFVVTALGHRMPYHHTPSTNQHIS